MTSKESFLLDEMRIRTKVTNPPASGNLVFRAYVAPTIPATASSANIAVDPTGGVTYSLIVSAAASDHLESIRQLNDALAGRVTITDVTSMVSAAASDHHESIARVNDALAGRVTTSDVTTGT